MGEQEQTNVHDESIIEKEKEVLSEANLKKEWESHGQWMKRKEFLLKMLKYHKENGLDINVDKFSKFGHMFFNIKYLSCQYDKEVENEIRKYDQLS
ncbi:conserved protein, unknown function [Hepatocystis sp. ex Piliocolobus tephrosceles]|nr:conserved protein, unknown function [Hepatocystis sp. ex Piliocolobus tephrosceles]